MKPSISDNLETCKETRLIAAQSLAKVLKNALGSSEEISEADFSEQWLKELQKNKNVFLSGWYTPPPNGMGVLFANESDFDRVHFKSLRNKKFWPKKNVFLDRKKGYLNFYFSPVAQKNYIIGDFGLTVYLGSKDQIKNHLKHSFKVIKEIFNGAKSGTKLKDFYQYSQKIFSKNKVVNNWWVSVSDPTGINTGHSIPGTFEDWTHKEMRNLKSNNWGIVTRTISQKRIFINSQEETKIKPGAAITIEPRLRKTPFLPIAFFHTIAIFGDNGKKELLTNFDEIFKISKMNYML